MPSFAGPDVAFACPFSHIAGLNQTVIEVPEMFGAGPWCPLIGAVAALNAPPAATAPATSAQLFQHLATSAGIVFGPLLLAVSFGLVVLIVLLAAELRFKVAIPLNLVHEIREILARGATAEALDAAGSDRSLLGVALAAGLGRLPRGLAEARDAISNSLESAKAGSEQLISYLATIGTLGPMIGLVGTVFGMILSFMELSRGGTPNAAALAAGISHALVVTLFGVGISIPAIFCHGFFRYRLARIVLEVASVADNLVTEALDAQLKDQEGNGSFQFMTASMRHEIWAAQDSKK
jgi:biopolymer transport protein ExbB